MGLNKGNATLATRSLQLALHGVDDLCCKRMYAIKRLISGDSGEGYGILALASIVPLIFFLGKQASFTEITQLPARTGADPTALVGGALSDLKGVSSAAVDISKTHGNKCWTRRWRERTTCTHKLHHARIYTPPLHASSGDGMECPNPSACSITAETRPP